MSTNFFFLKVCLFVVDNAQHLKQPFPPMILIFTEDEGDGIESRLPLKKILLQTIYILTLLIGMYVAKLSESYLDFYGLRQIVWWN